MGLVEVLRMRKLVSRLTVRLRSGETVSQSTLASSRNILGLIETTENLSSSTYLPKNLLMASSCKACPAQKEQRQQQCPGTEFGYTHILFFIYGQSPVATSQLLCSRVIFFCVICAPSLILTDASNRAFRTAASACRGSV